MEESPRRPGCQRRQSQFSRGRRRQGQILRRGRRRRGRRLGGRPIGAVVGEGEVAARALLPLTAQIPLRDPGDLQKRAVGHDQTCVLHTLVTIKYLWLSIAWSVDAFLWRKFVSFCFSISFCRSFLPFFDFPIEGTCDSCRAADMDPNSDPPAAAAPWAPLVHWYPVGPGELYSLRERFNLTENHGDG